MNEPRTSDRKVDRVIRSWLNEDRHEDVSRVAGMVLDLLDTTPQRRSPWWPAWRTPVMNKFLSLGVGAAAVAVALVIGAQVLGSPAPDGVGGVPPASPSLAPAPNVTEPSPSPMSAPLLTQSFTSQMHGISVSYPEGWTIEAAAEPWMDGPNSHSFDNPQDDHLKHPAWETTEVFMTLASQPIGDSSPEDWIAEQMAQWEELEGCTAYEPIAVDGASGRIGGEGCDLAVVTTDGRGYWIALRAWNKDQSAVAPFDRGWFEEVLATVQLQPEDAVNVAPSASP